MDAFARGRNKENWRSILRGITRLAMGMLKLLVASIYFRSLSHRTYIYLLYLTIHAIKESVQMFSVISYHLSVSSRVITTIIFAIILIPLCAAQSLAAKRIIITTWVSVAAYVLWLMLVTYAYTQGTLDVNPSRFRLGILWKGTSCVS